MIKFDFKVKYENNLRVQNNKSMKFLLKAKFSQKWKLTLLNEIDCHIQYDNNINNLLKLK